MSNINTQTITASSLHPEDTVSITVKMNGLSVTFSKFIGEAKNRSSFFDRVRNLFRKTKDTSKSESESLKAEVIKLFKPYLPDNATVTGEIVGYYPGSKDCIKKGYDYGCEEGKYKFVPCRIVTRTKEFDYEYEWSSEEVQMWTEHIAETVPELKDKLLAMKVIWCGRIIAFYPKLTENETDFLSLLRIDRRIGLDRYEPLCKNEVVREGVVVRPSKTKEFYVLKSQNFKN